MPAGAASLYDAGVRAGKTAIWGNAGSEPGAILAECVCVYVCVVARDEFACGALMWKNELDCFVLERCMYSKSTFSEILLFLDGIFNPCGS